MTSLGFIFMSLLEYILVLNTDPRFWTERRREQKSEKMKSLYKVRDAFNSSIYGVVTHCKKCNKIGFIQESKGVLDNLTI